MNLLELRIIIDETIKMTTRNPERVVVGIHNNKSGTFGALPITNIKSAGLGMDWDSNTFFLNPEEPMKEMGLKDKLENV